MQKYRKNYGFFPGGDSSEALGVTSIATGILVAAVSIFAAGMIAVDSHEVHCQQTQGLCNFKPVIKPKGINIP